MHARRQTRSQTHRRGARWCRAYRDQSKDCDGWNSIGECDAHVVDMCVGLERDAGREPVSHCISLDNGA